VTEVAFAMMVLELDGQDELTETEMELPEVADAHTPPGNEGKVAMQLCDTTKEA
jgi:hypothetical protein